MPYPTREQKLEAEIISTYKGAVTSVPQNGSDGQYGWKQYTVKDGKTHIWACASGWAVADLIDNHYRNHRYFSLLCEAIDNALGWIA